MTNTDLIRMRLKQAYEDSGLSYAAIEKKTGISHSTIQRYVTGVSKKMSINDVASIVKALGRDPADIIGWDNRPELMPSTHAAAGIEPDDEDDLFELREQMRRDPAMRTLFDLARRAYPSDVRAAAAMLKALGDQADE